MIPRTLLAGAVLALSATAASALDLLHIWEAANQRDPQGWMAAASRAAGAARHEQGAALWRPQIGFSSSAGWSSAQSQMNGAQFAAPGFGQSNGVAFATSVNGGTATRWALSARQPLYNPERKAQQEQLDISAQASEHEWKLTQQDWMLQTTQRYFDVVLTEHRLVLIHQQQKAVDDALTEAKDRFALGDAPITDTHEASARAQALRAQAILARNDWELARQVLADVTGLSVTELKLSRPAVIDHDTRDETLSAWLQKADQHNPMIRLSMAQVAAADQEVQKHTASAAPTMDLVAQASREHLSGSGDFGTASNTQHQQLLGLMLNVPIYTGGWRSAKLKEAVHLQDKARAELERTRLQVSQTTRAAWMAVQSAQSRIQALEAARTASQARLDATQLGRQVGDRTTLDLLNAQNDASAADLSLLQARVDVLVGQLRLQAAAGQLDRQQLQKVNAALQD